MAKRYDKRNNLTGGGETVARTIPRRLLTFISATLVALIFFHATKSEAVVLQEKTSQEQRKDDLIGLGRLRPKCKLGKIPALVLNTREGLSEAKISQIKKYISQLADISSPDSGLSATMDGQAFLPLPGQTQSSAMVLTNHGLKSSDALTALVGMGPDALPYLLDALGDKTPTKLKLEHRSGMGAMWLDNEMPGNPVNEVEEKVLGSPERRTGNRMNEKSLESYTVKIGDVCFVAIGQIVGRSYQAVRYQPTSCIVINSPTEDTQLREHVRKIWSSDNPTRTLLKSLLIDYATEGVFQGPSLDSWELGSDLQIQSAMRLLYYYPKESAELIGQRLSKLDVMKSSDHGGTAYKHRKSYIQRAVANGVRVADFVKEVSWCREPQIREAIRTIFTTSDDMEVLLATVPGVIEDGNKIDTKRLKSFIDDLPPIERRYGDGHELLVGMAQYLGKESVPAFESYLKNATVQRCRSAIEALRHGQGDWFIDTLRRQLDDTRTLDGPSYLTLRKESPFALPIRVCDLAAQVLSSHRPELQFKLEGLQKELDVQIKLIREKLSAKHP